MPAKFVRRPAFMFQLLPDILTGHVGLLAWKPQLNNCFKDVEGDSVVVVVVLLATTRGLLLVVGIGLLVVVVRLVVVVGLLVVVVVRLVVVVVVVVVGLLVVGRLVVVVVVVVRLVVVVVRRVVVVGCLLLNATAGLGVVAAVAGVNLLLTWPIIRAMLSLNVDGVVGADLDVNPWRRRFPITSFSMTSTSCWAADLVEREAHRPGYCLEQVVPFGHPAHARPFLYICPLIKFPAGP